MYSKKVMELFKNPKHVGEIKNADGVGIKGNPLCVLPKTKIQLNPSLTEISSVTSKDKVLSHDGNYHKIKKIFKRKYSGEIIKIKNRLGVTYLTPDHACLAIKFPETYHFAYLKNKKKEKSFWYHAHELEKRDILLYPILKKTKDINKIKIDIKKPKWDFKSKIIPKEVKINSDFLRLIGYYLAEGYAREEKCKTYITFTFHLDEKEYAIDVKRIIKRIFNLDSVLKTIKKRNTLIVSVYSAQLTRFLKKLCSASAANKKIPNFMLWLPTEKQKHLIKGLWRGDGFINRKIPRAGYSTISFDLCQQLKILLMRQKIISSIYPEDAYTSKDGVKHRKSYRIHVGNRESLLNLLNILGIKLNILKPSASDAWTDNDFIYVPITEISKEKYKGFVNNLEVEYSKSYVSEALTLHNCGDSMKVYIKVKNEKIVDVKFETFGCAAAISASEALCRLAKGKRIEDALKLKEKDIVDYLGGLPPIKHHCSLLGMKTLHKAIDNYKSRKKLI